MPCKISSMIQSLRYHPTFNTIAAIDIGSNALRAVIARVTASKIDIIRSLRFPLRLGDAVFQNQLLSPQKIRETEEAFIKLLHLFSAYNVIDVRAIATSAMRDARNSKLLIDDLLALTGIEIEVISGLKEAEMIFQAVQTQIKLKNKRAVLMDIGGGSTEISLVDDAQLVASHSFNVGTVRLIRMKNVQDQQTHINDISLEMSRFVRSRFGTKSPDIFIGTGGNLRRIGKIRRQFMKKPSTECTLSEINRMTLSLSKMSYAERIHRLKLEPNRADVIVPATLLTQRLMSELSVKKVLLPKVGLKEGLLMSMVTSDLRTFDHLR